jgi:hypothetical protein
MDKRKELQKKLKDNTDEYSEAFRVIEKFYRDLAIGKVSENDYPLDQSKIALENQIKISELIDQIEKLDEHEYLLSQKNI